MKKRILLFIMVVLFFVTLNNCNAGSELQEELLTINNEGKDTDADSNGQLNIVLNANKGSSLSGIQVSKKEDVINLFITIDNLEVHKTSNSDAGWHSLPIEEGSYDLMALDKTAWAELISSSDITPGIYNKLRFMVSDAEVTTASGTYNVEIPSGKIKINLSFIITDDKVTEITMVIDPKKSLKITGSDKNPKYRLNPVFKISGISDGDVD